MEPLPRHLYKLHRKWMPDKIKEAADRGEDIYIDDDGNYSLDSETIIDHLPTSGDNLSKKGGLPNQASGGKQASCPTCGGECWVIGDCSECKDCGQLFQNGKVVLINHQ